MTPRQRLPFRAAALALALAFAGSALAQYKIVGPDGGVTYTDLPPPPGVAGRVVELGRRGATAPADAATPALPAELQRVAARHPVTLFSGQSCPPCDRGREQLKARGVPYAERSVASAEDVDALQARTGARTLPALAIGQHVLSGWTASEWEAYLDAAGYPRSSRLPPSWAAPPVQPLAPRPTAEPGAAEPGETAAAPAAPALPPAPAAGTFRF
ncbi:MAG: glutaredoxin family protein [Burkholderiales bacterium]|nr:glutaredoxin family protein [Burkholderiales bacterium]